VSRVFVIIVQFSKRTADKLQSCVNISVFVFRHFCLIRMDVFVLKVVAVIRKIVKISLSIGIRVEEVRTDLDNRPVHHS
jgi:hypothetical protein